MTAVFLPRRRFVQALGILAVLGAPQLHRWLRTAERRSVRYRTTSDALRREILARVPLGSDIMTAWALCIDLGVRCGVTESHAPPGFPDQCNDGPTLRVYGDRANTTERVDLVLSFNHDRRLLRRRLERVVDV